MPLLAVLSLALASTAAGALPPVSAATDYAHINHNIVAPQLIHSFEPAYTSDALAARIEGTVVIEAIIGVNGQITYASVLSPLPAGLDWQALEVIKRWRYRSGSMDGVAIPVLTTIDVVFRLPYGVRRQIAVPPVSPANQEQAAYLGNAQAELALGDECERRGNFEQAARYYRFCAADRDATCQFKLGNILVNGPDINPNDFAQGVAWLRVAKENGSKAAATLLSVASAKLSSVQLEWVSNLQDHLQQPKTR